MPISSHQISGLIAGQQQMAMASHQQAMMIGAPHPMFQGAPSPSMGASSYPPTMGPPPPMVMPMSPGMAPMTGMGMNPHGMAGGAGGFSYGVGQGPSFGTHAGAMGIGAMGTAGMGFGAMTGAAGIAEMMGARNPLIRGMGMMDPMGAAFNVGGRAMGLGARMGLGAAGSGALGLAAGTGVGAVALAGMEGVRQTGRAFMGGFQQQNALNAQLSQMGFANPMAASGRGFAPEQQRAIGAGMRSFAAADPFTSMSETQGLMSQFTDMGMAQGVRDAEEFSKKFTKMAETVRSMAMAMGTSLQEAAGTFGQMRQAGFFTASEVMGNTTQMNMLRGMGMSTEQFTQMQMSGAGMARSQGMMGQAGARGVTQMTQRLMTGMTPNRERLLMDITGAQDAAGGASMMGQRLTGGVQQVLQGQFGKAMLAGLGQIEEGQFTGQLDQGQLQKFLSGDISGQQLSALGQKRMSGASGESFVRQQQNLRQSAMGQQEDMLPAIMRLLESTAGGNEDTMAILAKRFAGMDEATFTFAKSLADKHEETNRTIRQQVAQEGQAQAMQAEISRNRSFSGLTQRVRGGVEDFFSPVGQLGADFASEMEAGSMRATDRLFGISRTNVTAGSLRASSFEAVASGTIGGDLASRGSTTATADDFRKGNVTERSLMGAVARSQGMDSALALSKGMGRNLGGALGLSQTRQDALVAKTEDLAKNPRLRGLISRAQKARRDGKGKEVKRLRSEIDNIIRTQTQDLGTEGATEFEDQAIKDTAFILSKLDGGSLVAEQMKDEAGLALPDEYKSQKQAMSDIRAEVSKEFGVSISGTRTMASLSIRQAAKPFGVAGQVAAEAFLAATGIGDMVESEFEELVAGGSGSETLAAIAGKEDAFLAIRGQADELDGAARQKYLKGALKSLTGRDLSASDIEAALEVSSGEQFDDPEQFRKLTGVAKRAELARNRPAMRAAAGGALAQTKIKGLEEELKAASVGAFKGDTEGIEELVRAATERGDVASMTSAGGVGQKLARGVGLVKKAKQGEFRSRARLAAAFGVDEATLESMGAKDQVLSTEQATKFAEKLAAGGVLGQATAGAQGVAFRGGMESEAEMLRDTQGLIRENTELIALLRTEIESNTLQGKVTGATDAAGGVLSSMKQAVFGKPRK